MDIDNDYDNDGNNIVPCPICLSNYCPSKEDGKCPREDEFVRSMTHPTTQQVERLIEDWKERPVPQNEVDVEKEAEWLQKRITKLTHTTAQEVLDRVEGAAGTSKDELQGALQKIGWTMKGKYPNEYVVDHDGKRTNYRVIGDGIEVIGVDKHTCISFFYKGCEVQILNDEAVALGTEKCFILFMNHNLNRKALTPKDTEDKEDSV